MDSLSMDGLRLKDGLSKSHEDVVNKLVKNLSDHKNFPCRRPRHVNSRRFEFERYLDLTGVTKALGQALGRLCAQKPKPLDPMRFIVDQMRQSGLVAKWSENVISLRNELSELRTMVMYAQTENDRIRSFLLRSGQITGEPGDEEDVEGEFQEEEELKTEVRKSERQRSSLKLKSYTK